MAKRYRDIVGDGGSDVAGQLAEKQTRLAQRMSRIKYKIAIMSGKGGVGKSTITTNLAAALARQGYSVGVADADVYGPSTAQMLGLRNSKPVIGGSGLVAPETDYGVKLVSMDFLLEKDNSPVVWDGPQRESFAWKGTLEMHALREFLGDTAWGELDFLLIDLPPGTNQFATLTELVPDLTGTLVISTPTRVSRLVVGRSLTMIRQVLKARVLGVVENMSGYFCTQCNQEQPLFTATQKADYGGVPLLAEIPFDPRMTEAADGGEPFVISQGKSPAGRALHAMSSLLVERIQTHPMGV